ncbi:ribosomal protection-like ABC-F family protein [Alicyclobacillus dauci]|uniref:ATP-binding cassette domain-containing protein n=1 Tax=Alicyclobacillus dauci TaxID=1475485 RepID=A0ABY6Z2W6_9BACL|nr:ATP-binding cassette domain-containing protein [Alicyclobacillus dauci]WAH36666.1 ATP-binding cassette domain-containing protein [Alicyclobacillus dauci]
MIVLQVSHLKKSYDTVDVLHDASLIVRVGDRVGLVGGNGAGKSTLVRIITGEEEPDAGQVTTREGTTIGYVSQFVDTPDDVTVYAFVAKAREHLENMERELRRLEIQMADPAVYEDADRFEQVSRQYDDLTRKFNDAGGYAWQADIRRVLAGLQFPSEMHQRSVSSLSGGQKTRLSLARLLATQPTLLVLDEPTNYLDTETLTWLEQFLKGYQGSILVVSHDRYFLDEVTNQTVELENGVTTSYTGNYDSYMEQKEAAKILQAKQFMHQQEEIANLEMFVAKNLARASTTKRAQSRRKMLERMERIEKPTGEAARVHLALSADRPSGRDVLQVQDLSIGYGQTVLSKNINFRLERGMRMAILGPNGMGKSTLLKTLLRQLPPVSGHFVVGQHVQIGYYDQEQSDLDESKTVLGHVWDEHPAMDRTTLRSALAQFLFRGDDVEKPVSGLSGGERSRLNLCRLMLQRANTLFMDEPTNHLDIPSKEALEDSLLDYDGTLLFISHDRYFIDAIATHVGVLSADGLTLYIGNYTDYREKVAENERMAAIEAAESSGQSSSVLKAERGAKDTATNAGTAASPRRRIRSSDVRKAQEAVTKWENAAADCEHALEATATLLSEAAQQQDLERIYALEAKLQELQDEHEKALESWEQASIELEQLQSELEQENG